LPFTGVLDRKSGNSFNSSAKARAIAINSITSIRLQVGPSFFQRLPLDFRPVSHAIGRSIKRRGPPDLRDLRIAAAPIHRQGNLIPNPDYPKTGGH
jgi:hypothetical protein